MRPGMEHLRRVAAPLQAKPPFGKAEMRTEETVTERFLLTSKT